MGVKNKIPFSEIIFLFWNFFSAKMLATNLCLSTFGCVFFFHFPATGCRLFYGPWSVI